MDILIVSNREILVYNTQHMQTTEELAKKLYLYKPIYLFIYARGENHDHLQVAGQTRIIVWAWTLTCRL